MCCFFLSFLFFLSPPSLFLLHICFQADAVPKECVGQMTNSPTRRASGAESKAAGVAEMRAAKEKNDEALRRCSGAGALKSNGEG